jgi:hypothetical protein
MSRILSHRSKVKKRRPVGLLRSRLHLGRLCHQTHTPSRAPSTRLRLLPTIATKRRWTTLLRLTPRGAHNIVTHDVQREQGTEIRYRCGSPPSLHRTAAVRSLSVSGRLRKSNHALQVPTHLQGLGERRNILPRARVLSHRAPLGDDSRGGVVDWQARS